MVRERASYAFFAALGALLAAVWVAVRPAGGWIYRRAAVLDGELWRLLTGQLVHPAGIHLLWNLAGLLVVASAFGPRLSPVGWLGAAAASLVGSGAGLLLGGPAVAAAAGFSGVLHGLFAAGAVAEARVGNFRLGLAALGLLAAKLAWERWVGPLPSVATALGGEVAVGAHLWGSVGGAAAGWLACRRRSRAR